MFGEKTATFKIVYFCFLTYFNGAFWLLLWASCRILNMYANRCYKLISLYTPSEGQLFTVLHVNCEACPSSLCFVNWPRLPMCWHNEWYCMWDFFSFSQPNKMFDNLIVLCLIPVWRLYFRHTFITYHWNQRREFCWNTFLIWY